MKGLKRKNEKYSRFASLPAKKEILGSKSGEGINHFIR